MDYDEHFLVLADLAPTTGADVLSIDMSELQESIVTAIAHLQGAENTDREAVLVNVYTGEADPFFGDMMPAPKRNLQANEVFPKTHHFKASDEKERGKEERRGWWASMLRTRHVLTPSPSSNLTDGGHRHVPPDVRPHQ